MLHDKGTFDAICVSNNLDDRVAYIRNVSSMLTDSGVLMITSCNWTSDELKALFTQHGFDVHAELEYPSFEFGGAKGWIT